MCPSAPLVQIMPDKVSLGVIYMVVLVGDTARGVMFPTLWPYVHSLGGNKISQGWMVGAFSMGRVVSSPWLGKWSTTAGYRIVLVWSSVVIALGTVAYALAQNLTMLFLAQVVMGVGSGTLGVTRAYVADKSPHDQRTYWLAYLTAVQYAGFTCMPMVGAALSEILQDANHTLRIGPLLIEFNQFTAPAYVMCAAALLCVALLCTVFRDAPPRKEQKPPAAATDTEKTPLIEMRDGVRGSEAQPTPAGNRTPSVALSSTSFFEPNLENGNGSRGVGASAVASPRLTPGQAKACGRFTLFDLAIGGGFLLSIATKGTIACFETLGAEYAMVHFNMNSAEAGATFATFGAIGVCSLLSMRLLCIWFTDVQLVLGGVAVMILSCFLLVPSPTGRSGAPQFLVAVFFMYSIGYPIGHTAVLGLFSKVVGQRPQGTLLGWFGSSGSLARILFPIAAGLIAQGLDSSKLFIMLVAVLSAAFVCLLATRRTYQYYAEGDGFH